MRKSFSTGQRWKFFGGVLAAVSCGSVLASARAAPQEHHTVTLKWDASEPVKVKGKRKAKNRGQIQEYKYNVYRSKQPGGPYLRINPDLVACCSYVDQNVQNGVLYYYVVRAVAGAAESADSNRASATIPTP